MARQAWGDAIVTVTEAAAAPLDFFFPDPRLGPPGGSGQFAAAARPRRSRSGQYGSRNAAWRSPTSTRRPPTRATPTCGCTCCRTAWSGRTASTSTASSGCCPPSAGPPGAGGRGRPVPAQLRAPAAGGAAPGQAVGQVPADARLRGTRPASGSPTRAGSGSARTWPRARSSCTRGSSTTTPERSAPRWSRDASARAWWSGPGTDVGGGAVDHGHAVRRRQGAWSRSASGACSAPTPGSASPWVTTAWSRPGSYLTAGHDRDPARRRSGSRRAS